ncbi:MAG: 50S ribosomal protein L29 [bacterium]
MTPEELRSRTPDDLKTQVHEMQEELFKLRLQKGTGQLEKSHRLKEVKRDIARAMTVLNEKLKKDQSK